MLQITCNDLFKIISHVIISQKFKILKHYNFYSLTVEKFGFFARLNYQVININIYYKY